jgi:hypothetical protein
VLTRRCDTIPRHKSQARRGCINTRPAKAGEGGPGLATIVAAACCAKTGDLRRRAKSLLGRLSRRAASYSAIACCPSRSCSFFLKAASARSRARSASVSNVVTPLRAIPLAGQTFLPEDRMPPVDVGSSTEPTLFQVICSTRTPTGLDAFFAPMHSSTLDAARQSGSHQFHHRPDGR